MTYEFNYVSGQRLGESANGRYTVHLIYPLAGKSDQQRGRVIILFDDIKVRPSNIQSRIPEEGGWGKVGGGGFEIPRMPNQNGREEKGGEGRCEMRKLLREVSS